MSVLAFRETQSLEFMYERVHQPPLLETRRDNQMTTAFRLGELFCGPGGVALGARLAQVKSGKHTYSISHAWATDYDKDTCDTYRRNIGDHNYQSVVCRDVRKLNFDSLAQISEIDALAFGFPCNDFSMVGEQKGIDGAYGPLYAYAVKAVKFFKPKWFFAENVGGLKSSDEGKTLEKILDELSACGYNVVPHLYKFENYSVPQARHRIIIVGIRGDLDVEFQVPHSQSRFVSCSEAIETPPIKTNAENHELTLQSAKVIERLKHIRPGENAFTAKLPKHLQLNIKGAKISQIYKRLQPDKPAYTITGSGGGGTHVYHWRENRALTNRERARLQTFPDNFVFCGSKESVRKQIGMAVPPIGAKVIFESILKSFAGVDYPNIPSNIPPRKAPNTRS